VNDPRPLIAHVLYRFDVGGLENGVVNLINRMPADRVRHMVVALTDCVPAFCERITRPDVEFVSLHKTPGHGVKLYPALHRLFREHRPAIVHTRNLAALEAVVPAWAAGVPVRIHGEHGWDVSDPNGERRKFRLIRRLYRPFVSRYVALSGHIERYLIEGVGVAPWRIERICNGVDSARFSPAPGRPNLRESPFQSVGEVVVGTVGRLQAVKDQLTLVRAFARAIEKGGDAAAPLRLIIAGDGPLRSEVEVEIARAGIAERVWLAGERRDVPDLMRGLDVFVLPSQSEGISNTILEAMACGLPVIATAVGGNGELVVQDETGSLVPPLDADALADALLRYAADPAMRIQQGRAGRERIEAGFSLDRMIDRYVTLYRSQLDAAARRGRWAYEHED